MSYQQQGPWPTQFGVDSTKISGRESVDQRNEMKNTAVNAVSNSQLMEGHGKIDHSHPRMSPYSPSNSGYTQPYGGMPSNVHPSTIMMMNSQMSPMVGGIIPLSVVMPPNFQLDTSNDIKKPKKRRKKDKNKPKRPLSAYNLFFKDEREKILQQIPKESEIEVDEKITWPGKKRPPHGKISFEELARTIGARWQSLDKESKLHYKKKADEDLERYATEMKIYDKRSKQQFKSPPSDDELQEDDTKRPREDTKVTPSSDSKRKKTRRPSKDLKEGDSSPTKNMELMNSAMQDSISKMMSMNVPGSYMIPMMFNPSAGQPMDELEMMKAQQKMLSDKIALETERRRKIQYQQQGNLDPRKNDFHGIQQNHSFNQNQYQQRYGSNNDDLNPLNPNSTSPLFMGPSFDQGSAVQGMFNQYRNSSARGQELNNNYSNVHNNETVDDFPPFPPVPEDTFFDRTD